MESNEMNKTVEDLESKFARGLQFADMLGFSNQQNIKENATNAQTLIELLIAKGLIRLDEFEERKKAVSKYIEEKMEINMLKTIRRKWDRIRSKSKSVKIMIHHF